MKLFHLLGFLIVLGISLCGFVQAVSMTSADTGASPADGTIDSVPAAGLTLAMLSNDKPSTGLTLEPGVIIVTFQAYDPQLMTISQDCKQSGAQSSGMRISSPYNGSVAFGIPEKDECTINISSSGSWTAQVSQYDLNNPLKAPVNLSGSGTAVSLPFALEKGKYIFERNEIDIFERKEIEIASPMYFLEFANGSYLMDANNTFVEPGFEDNPTETFRIVDIPETGTYFLSTIANINNPMPWNASIIALPPAPQMGPGPAIRE